MKLFAVVVWTGSMWARRSLDGEKQKNTLEEFLADPEIKQTTERLTRFGDRWRVVRIHDDEKTPNEVVHYHQP